jgi:hypothetical protein
VVPANPPNHQKGKILGGPLALQTSRENANYASPVI